MLEVVYRELEGNKYYSRNYKPPRSTLNKRLLRLKKLFPRLKEMTDSEGLVSYKKLYRVVRKNHLGFTKNFLEMDILYLKKEGLVVEASSINNERLIIFSLEKIINWRINNGV